MKKTVVLSIFVLGIQGCSGNSPSTSDVAKALKSGFLDCPGLSIENVKVVNGVQLDEQTHEVQAQFDIKVIPLPDSKVQEVETQMQAYEAEAKAISDHVADVDQQVLDVLAQRTALDNQIAEELKAGGLQFQSDEWFQSFRKIRAERGGKELDDKQDSLRGEQGTSRTQRPSTQKVTLVEAWGGYSCLRKSGVPQDVAGSNTNATEAVTKGAENSYEVKFPMIKSDNGWIKAN